MPISGEVLVGALTGVASVGISAQLIILRQRRILEEFRVGNQTGAEAIQKVRTEATSEIERARHQWFQTEEKALALEKRLSRAEIQVDKTMERLDECREREAQLRSMVTRNEVEIAALRRDVDRSDVTGPHPVVPLTVSLPVVPQAPRRSSDPPDERWRGEIQGQEP